MRCLQWDWTHLKLVLMSRQNEAPFTQTSQAIAHYWIICTGLLNLWLSFVYKSRKDFCIFCSPSTLGHKSCLRLPWPNFVAFAGSSGQKPPPDFQPHFFFLSGLCDFLGFLLCCCCILSETAFAFLDFSPWCKGALSFLRILLSSTNQAVLVLSTKHRK